MTTKYLQSYLPDEFDQVDSIFRKREAYSRFKDLLDKKGHLEN